MPSDTRIGSIVAAALLLLIPHWLQAQVVINFDTDPSGAPVAAGTVINSTYAALGVTLASESASLLCGSPTSVYANSDRPLGFGSSPNVVSSCPQGLSSAMSQNSFGTIHAHFVRPVIRVCIDVVPNSPSDLGTIIGYGTTVAFAAATSAPGIAQTICVAGTPLTGKLFQDVRFSGSGSHFARFDNLSIMFAASTSPGVDSNNDGKSDFAIYRDGSFFLVALSIGVGTQGVISNNIGPSRPAVPAPGRYSSVQSSDAADYESGIWRYQCFSPCGDPVTPLNKAIGFGGAGFLPVQADYDGDGFTDLAVYSNGAWSILRSSDGANPVVAHGGPGWTPVPRDYDGDGKADIAAYIDGAWSIVKSTNGSNTVFGHGGPGWQPVPADYDGDGKADIAVYSNGAWSIIRSSDGGNTIIGHGGPGWIPLPADYDGDGKADAAVFLNGTWSVKRSSDGRITVITNWGNGPTDIPVN